MKLRAWATPLTIGSSLIVTITGLMLFFHLSPGLTRTAHEWLGWVMAAAMIAHIVVNWRAFTGYFKRPVALIILGVSALMMALTPLGTVSGNTAANPVPLVMGAMSRAPLTALFDMAGLTPEEGVAKLEAQGITATSDQRMNEITQGDRAVQTRIIAALFAD